MRSYLCSGIIVKLIGLYFSMLGYILTCGVAVFGVFFTVKCSGEVETPRRGSGVAVSLASPRLASP